MILFLQLGYNLTVKLRTAFIEKQLDDYYVLQEPSVISHSGPL